MCIVHTSFTDAYKIQYTQHTDPKLAGMIKEWYTVTLKELNRFLGS